MLLYIHLLFHWNFQLIGDFYNIVMLSMTSRFLNPLIHNALFSVSLLECVWPFWEFMNYRVKIGTFCMQEEFQSLDSTMLLLSFIGVDAWCWKAGQLWVISMTPYLNVFRVTNFIDHKMAWFWKLLHARVNSLNLL